MKNTKLKRKIINLIPSETITEYVNKNRYSFSDLDMVLIVRNYANTWQEMMNLYDELKNNIEDVTIKKYLLRLIKMEKKQYDLFMKIDNDFVYEACLDYESMFNRYLTSNFEEATVTMKTWLRQNHVEQSSDEYLIMKRKICARRKNNDLFIDDSSPRAYLNSKLEIIRFSSNVEEPKYDDLEINIDAIKYPDIFKKGDLVRFAKIKGTYYISDGVCNQKISQLDDKHYYGINSFDSNSSGEACVLLLDSEYVHNRSIEEKDENGYYPYLMCHDHIDFGCLELVKPNEAPLDIKNDYYYAKDALEIINGI